jgi:hypothetical protein
MLLKLNLKVYVVKIESKLYEITSAFATDTTIAPSQPQESIATNGSVNVVCTIPVIRMKTIHWLHQRN